MSTTEKTTVREKSNAVRDEDFFLGAQGTASSQITAISAEQAALLQGECGAEPSAALVQAFETRLQNQAQSKTSK